MDSYKNFCVYFTHLPGSPLGGICIKFCMTGPLADVINPAKFYLNRVRGFDSVGGSNFWLSHKKEKSPLTQGLNYRSACDILFTTTTAVTTNNTQLQPAASWLSEKYDNCSPVLNLGLLKKCWKIFCPKMQNLGLKIPIWGKIEAKLIFWAFIISSVGNEQRLSENCNFLLLLFFNIDAADYNYRYNYNKQTTTKFYYYSHYYDNDYYYQPEVIHLTLDFLLGLLPNALTLAFLPARKDWFTAQC